MSGRSRFAIAISFFFAVLAANCCHAQTSGRSPRAFVVAVGFSDEQPVFRREAAKAGQVLGAYYGRGGAVHILPNRQHPAIPDANALAQELRATAAEMDRQNDILIVFLTSHGSPDGIAITRGKTNDTLSPGQLRQMLDATGVRRKVLIVSACYSGVFIGLANDSTAVITAADAVSPSFGCTNEARLTYFGRAFLKDSIPDTPTLAAAFAKAKPIIGKRETGMCGHGRELSAARQTRLIERGECFKRSNPQMSGGAEFIKAWRATNGSAADKN